MQCMHCLVHTTPSRDISRLALCSRFGYPAEADIEANQPQHGGVQGTAFIIFGLVRTAASFSESKNGRRGQRATKAK